MTLGKVSQHGQESSSAGPQNSVSWLLLGGILSRRFRDGRGATWFARLIVLVVFLSNLSAAIPFIVRPARYAWGFEVQGVVGDVVVRSFGLLFLMWVVPYVPVIVHPVKYRVCFLVILAQQCLGLVGESWMWAVTPLEHAALRATGLRFIVFDAVGLFLLWMGWFVTRS